MARNKLLYLVPIVNTVGGGFFWFDSVKSQGLKWYFSSMEEDTGHLIKDDDQRTEFV